MSQYVVGLTGGIGSGKTAVSDTFHSLGIDIVDADVCARDVVALGEPALALITDRFGPDILLPDGNLDRQQLRTIVFADENQKAWLNALLHPLIRQRMIEQIQASTSPYCVLVVPLLLENNMQAMVDRVLVVDVPSDIQIKRVHKRDGSDIDTINAIVDSQMDRGTRVSLADDVIENNSDLVTLKNKVAVLHETYLKQVNAASST